MLIKPAPSHRAARGEIPPSRQPGVLHGSGPGVRRCSVRSFAVVLTLLVMLLGSSCAGGSEASDSTSDDGEPDSSDTESSAQDNVDESGAEVLTPAGTRWVVDSLIASTGAAESVAPLGGDDLAWMAFGQGVLVGEIGCVGFRGGYTLDGDAMELTDEIEQSVGDCDQPHPLENEVVPALDLVTTWSSDGARLDLLGDDRLGDGDEHPGAHHGSETVVEPEAMIDKPLDALVEGPGCSLGELEIARQTT